MKLTDADWLTSEPTQTVFAFLAPFPTYAVGGCVRNTLLGVEVKDIDLATQATPDEISRRAAPAGLRVIPPGVEHGAVTVIADDTTFEVTAR